MDPKQPFSKQEPLSVMKTIRLSHEQAALLTDLAKAAGQSEADFMREALNLRMKELQNRQKVNH